MNRRPQDRRKRINVVDLFSGGGGWSEGAKQAAKARDIRLQSLGLNHWDIAIKTYNKNHPSHNATEAELFEADPSRLVLDGVDILIASPECIHHSNARGGAPRCDQSRSQAYIVYNWTKTHLPKMVLIENVVEWKTWGPLYSRGPKKGTAIKSKKGSFYNKFCKDMKDLGYVMNSKEVVAADYGAPTTRKRLFVVFTLEDIPAFTFPESTHTKGESWVPAKEIIDWELEGNSIFQRKKPLSDKTLDRIWHGIQRYCKEEFKPFLVKFYGTAKSASLDNPLPTVTCVDRMGIVTTYGLDVRFRMLQPHELAAAMGFPEDYEFEGTKRDQVKQIGNAVAVDAARAIFGQALDILLETDIEVVVA